MIAEHLVSERADAVMGQMVREIRRVFPQLRVDSRQGGPENEAGTLVVHIPRVGDLDPSDVAGSVRELVATIGLTALTEEQLYVWITSELDEHMDDPGLLAQLAHHWRLVEVLETLYPSLTAVVARPGNEIEVVYYPTPAVDARIRLHGTITDSEMRRVQTDTQTIIGSARRDDGLRIELTQAP